MRRQKMLHRRTTKKSQWRYPERGERRIPTIDTVIKKRSIEDFEIFPAKYIEKVMAENALLERAVNLILQNEKTEKVLVEEILESAGTEALERMTVPSEICVHTRDAYVSSRILKLEELAGSGWKDTKGEPIRNAEEWKRVYAAVHALPDAHQLSEKTEKHSYSGWLQEEMEKRKDECRRTMGQRLEPETRTEPGRNGVSG